MTLTFLVLDASTRSALAVTRSLGKMEGVSIVTAEAAPIALAGTSRYSDEYRECPSSTTEPQAFIDWLKHLLNDREIALVLPTTEITSQLLLLQKDQFPQLCLPFADYDTVMSLADKYTLLEHARAAGLDIPRTQRVDHAGDLDISTLSYPCVIKPCQSRIFNGETWINTSVKVVHTSTEAEAYIGRTAYLHQYPFMIQEFIPGSGAGIFCLYHQGEAQAFFAHERLREKPPQGGVSTLSQSAPLNDALRLKAKTLLDSVGWHGVAMVEFRVADDGTAYIMEVNTRFWGSLQLAIDCGIDFPRWLVEFALDRSPAIRKDYPVHKKLRWLLGDLDSLYIYFKSDYSLLDKCRRLMQFLKPDATVTHEVYRSEDRAPAWFECKTYIKQFFQK